MIGLLCFVLTVLASPFKSKMRLEAENAVLWHQLIVLRRKLRGRVQFANSDRWFLVQLYRWFPTILKVLTIIRPRDPCALASGWFSQLLAPEVTIIGGAAADRDGAARADPADEHGEPSFGARHASTANFSSLGLRSLNQVSPSTWSSDAGRQARDGSPSSAITPPISPPWTCSLFQLSVLTAQCICHRPTRPQRSGLDQRHKESDDRMGCTPNNGGISLG